MNEEERRRLELEAEAEAEAEYEYSQIQKPQPQGSFLEELTSGKNLYGKGTDNWGTLGQLGEGVKALGGAALEYGKQVAESPHGMYDPGIYAPIAKELVKEVNSDNLFPDMISAWPGATTAATAAGEAWYLPENAPRSNYGKMLQGEAVPLVAGAAVGKLARVATGVDRAANTAAREAAIADPATQAALRYAENRGLLNTPSAKSAIEAGKITPEIQDAARVAQQEARATARPVDPNFPDISQGKDYLPGTALGYPESSASTRPFAASETMAEAGPTLIGSGAYQGADRINPFTGKFEGLPVPVRDATHLANKLEQASVDIISARKQTVNALDEAMNSINQQSPGQPKVRGIIFDTDVAPVIDGLRELINKRKMLKQTAPISEAMEGAYSKIEESFNAIQNSSLMNRWNKIGPTGSREMGELTPSQALSMIENMNAFRRAVGEFDEAGKAAGLNSTFSDFTGRGAELKAISQVQEGLQSVLEQKASEILSLAPMVKGYYNWQEALAPIRDDTLSTMNKTYSAFQTGQEAARTYNNTTNRGMVTPEPGRLISAVQQGQESIGNQVVQGITSPGKTLISRGINKVFGDPASANIPLQAAQRNMTRPNAAISQVLDGLLLREKPVPILSRNWDKVKYDTNAMSELQRRAEMIGIPFAIFNSLSDPAKREIHKQVINTFPEAAEATPDNLNLINGEFQNPLEKDSLARQSMDLPVTERAMKMSGIFQNKYTPPSDVPTAAQTAPASTDIGDINSLLGDTTMQYPRSSQSSPQLTSMLNQLEYMTRIHAEDDLR